MDMMESLSIYIIYYRHQMDRLLKFQIVYILEGSYIDEKDIMLILKLNSQLMDNGIQTELYEHDRITCVEFLNNLVTSYCGINKEISERIDKEE